MIPIIRNSIKNSLQNFFMKDKFFWKLPIEYSGSICLTFDDGPDPDYTVPVLELLNSYNIKATFFLIGEKVKQYPDIVKKIVDSGHYVSAHTFTHNDITDMSNETLDFELYETRAIIKNITERDCITYRPPRGKLSLFKLWRSIASGYKVIHWTKTYSDYLQDGSKKLIARMKLDPPQDRDIILLHDNNPYTVDSLNFLIQYMKDKNMNNVVINESGIIIRNN